MYQFFLLIPMLLAIFNGAKAQDAVRKTEPAKAQSKPPEASIKTKQDLRRHIFLDRAMGPATPASRNTNAARNAAPASLPSNMSAAEAVQQNKEANARKAASPKPVDPGAQGAEPAAPAPTPKAKATSPKN